MNPAIIAKALTAAASSGLIGLAFHALPSVSVSPEWSSVITAGLTGLLTWLVPNKPTAKAPPTDLPPYARPGR